MLSPANREATGPWRPHISVLYNVAGATRPLKAHRDYTPRTNDHEQRTIFVEEPDLAKGRFYCPGAPWGFSHKCGHEMAHRGILGLVPNSAPELHFFSLPPPFLPQL